MSSAGLPHLYAIALGSNRRHIRHGSPRGVVAAAIAALNDARDVAVLAHSAVIMSHPIGPSQRMYANAATLIETSIPPDALLVQLKHLECDFGRRRGRRWGARVLDLDIILWSGGLWSTPALSIPHPRWRERRFVIDPLVTLAPDWRDPLSGLAVRHIAHRLRAPIVDPAPLTA